MHLHLLKAPAQGVAAICFVAAVLPASAVATATQDFRETAPDAVASPQTEQVAGYDVRPDLVRDDDGFRVFNSQVEATIARDPSEGFSMLASTDRRMVVAPTTAMSDADAVARPVRDAAVVAPAVQPGVDTALRPTASGMDVYENLAGGSDYALSWRVSLADSHLVQAESGDVLIVSDDDGSVAARVTAAVVDSGDGSHAALSVDGDQLVLNAGVPADVAQATVHYSITAERDLLAVEEVDPDSGRVTETVVDPPLARYLLSRESLAPARAVSAASSSARKRRSNPAVRAADSSGDVATTGVSGCRTVDKAHTQRTLLGRVAFRFHGVIGYCWNRKQKAVITVDVRPGYLLTDFDSFEQFVGITGRDDSPYNYASVGARSGYKHYIQARIDNCIPRAGCIGTKYPSVALYAHYDGTLHYSEQG